MNGCKWSLRQLRHYLFQNGIDDWLIWQRISSLIVLTIASQISAVPLSSNCFEFYGFDILIDADLKPWLLEVNLSPALGTDCDIDPAVKKPMLHDLFDLIGLPVCHTGLFKSLGCLYEADDETLSEGDDEPPIINNSAKTAANVVAMACKWRNQLNCHNRRNKAFSKPRPLASSNSKRNITKETRFIRNKLLPKFLNPVYDKDVGSGSSKEKSDSDGMFTGSKRKPSITDPPCMWDNGVDWRFARKESGDWVRAYPLLIVERVDSPSGSTGYNIPSVSSSTTSSIPRITKSSFGNLKDKETRLIVANISKISRLVKEIYTNNEGSTDDKKDNILLYEYLCTDAVWHPAPGFHEEIS